MYSVAIENNIPIVSYIDNKHAVIGDLIYMYMYMCDFCLRSLGGVF